MASLRRSVPHDPHRPWTLTPVSEPNQPSRRAFESQVGVSCVHWYRKNTSMLNAERDYVPNHKPPGTNRGINPFQYGERTDTCCSCNAILSAYNPYWVCGRSHCDNHHTHNHHSETHTCQTSRPCRSSSLRGRRPTSPSRYS